MHDLEGGTRVPPVAHQETLAERAPQSGRDIICDEETIDPADA